MLHQMDVPYKFPRLWKRYEVLVGIALSEEDAMFRAEQKLVQRNVYRPLDKVVFAYPVSVGFEAVLHFLHPKFECEMSALEKQYAQGILSRLVVVDTDKSSLEKIVNAAARRNVFDVQVCDNPRAAVEFVVNTNCDALLMRHNISGNNGLQVAQRLSKMNMLPRTVVYGSIHRRTIDYYYSSRLVWYVVKEHDADLILCAVEKVLNNARARYFSDFVLP